MSIGVQPSADPLLSHTSMTNYCKSLISYAQACQQVIEAFLDPNSKDPVGHRGKLGDWVFWKHHQRKTVLELSWKGPYQGFLTADTIAKLEDTGDFRIKLTRKRSSRH